MRLRTLAALLAAISLLLLAPVALAAYSTGLYRSTGRTTPKRFLRLSFLVSKAKTVKGLNFSLRQPGGCSDGSALRDEEEGYVITRSPIDPDGKFTKIGTFSSSTTKASFTLKGTLSGTDATGTLRSGFTRTGGLKCDTGTLHWKATLQK